MAATLLIWSTRLLTLLLVVVSVLPLIPSGEWWIRLWDFPRLQLAWALLLPLGLLALHAWRYRLRTEHAVWLVALLGTGAWQLSHILPFTSIWPAEVPTAENEPENGWSTFKMLTANIAYNNDRYAELLDWVRRDEPDILLLIEVDRDWAEALRPLDEHYPHRVGEVRGEGLGIVLWSRFPLLEQEVKHLVSDRRPSVFATLELPEVGPVRYVGIHPVPPGLRDRITRKDKTSERRDSRVRDAELMLVARHVEEDPESHWIVTGDFNDVGWSGTTRLFTSLSGLKDPRRGRELLNTYPVGNPLLRYPIDHLFVSDGFQLVDLDRVKVSGSDHFGISATFSVSHKSREKPDASAEDQQEASEMIEEGAEDAEEDDVSSD